MILSTIEDIVPSDHLVRKIEDCIDLSFIETDIKNKQQRARISPSLRKVYKPLLYCCQK